LQRLKLVIFSLVLFSGLLVASKPPAYADEGHERSVANIVSLPAKALSALDKKPAEQKLVFKFSFSPAAIQQAFNNAVEAVQNAFHRLGRYIESLLQNVDSNIRTGNRSQTVSPPAPKHLEAVQNHVKSAAHLYYAIDRRVKALAER
jgi:hypothetical protein